MLETYKEIKQSNELFAMDEKLIERIELLKRDGDYGEIYEASAQLVDALHTEGITREELGQVPAFHVLIGSTVPSQHGTVYVEKSISPERQRIIEARIDDFVAAQLKKLST